MNDLWGHPRGLYICFLTEMWERFSYYGMRALLVYYLMQHWGYTEGASYAIYGAYTALAWGLPTVGGILADRYFGAKRTVAFGAVLLSAGHLLMAIEGPRAMEPATGSAPGENLYRDLFFLSLALIATGVGLLKANISTLVGALYTPNDSRRDAGYTIFYLGINIGGFVAPLLCGWLGYRYGWSYGFGAAGIGMLLGLAIFLRGSHLLPEIVGGSAQTRANAGRWLWSVPGLVLVTWLLIVFHGILGPVLALCATALGGAILYFSFVRCTPDERRRMLVVVTLIGFAILFWSLYEQLGSSLNVFADRFVARQILGFEIQAAQLQGMPSLLVILLAPVATLVWTRLGARNREPGTAVKFGLALAFVGAALLMPAVGMQFADDGRIALVWYLLTFVLMVCGELCIAPVAMNMVSRLCPTRVVGMMMGSYFLSLSIGSFLAGKLAGLTQVKAAAAASVPVIGDYVDVYAMFAAVAVCVGLLLSMALAPALDRRIRN